MMKINNNNTIRKIKMINTELFKGILLHSFWHEQTMPLDERRTNKLWKKLCVRMAQRLVSTVGLKLVQPIKFGETHLSPEFSYTMVGKARLDNLEVLLKEASNIEGDFVECGVWRGGASMFAKYVLNTLDSTKTVWLFDSFEGLPKSNHISDKGSKFHEFDFLAVSQEDVMANFDRFGLLDERVKFVKGFFSNTAHSSKVENISVLRLDGDLYTSTMECLSGFYWKVSKGGYIIIDDFGGVKGCRDAVNDFRFKNGIKDQIHITDHSEIWWKKVSEPLSNYGL